MSSEYTVLNEDNQRYVHKDVRSGFIYPLFDGFASKIGLWWSTKFYLFASLLRLALLNAPINSLDQGSTISLTVTLTPFETGLQLPRPCLYSYSWKKFYLSLNNICNIFASSRAQVTPQMLFHFRFYLFCRFFSEFNIPYYSLTHVVLCSLYS